MMVELSVTVLMLIITALMIYCFVDFKYHVSYMELRKEMFDMQMESMMVVAKILQQKGDDEQ